MAAAGDTHTQKGHRSNLLAATPPLLPLLLRLAFAAAGQLFQVFFVIAVLFFFC